MSLQVANVPTVIGIEIFSFLYVQEWGQLGLVCKNWHHITDQDPLWNRLDLKKCFSSLTTIDGSCWQAVGVNVTDELAQKKVIVKTLRKLFAFPGIKPAGSTLLTMAKGLSLNKLLQYANASKNASPIKIHYCCNSLAEQYQDICIEKTHRVIITNEIVRSADVYKQGLGCKNASVLAAAALLVLTYLNSSKRLFLNDYMCCSDKVSSEKILVGNWQVLKNQCGFVIFHERCWLFYDKHLDIRDSCRFLQKNSGPVVMREF